MKHACGEPYGAGRDLGDKREALLLSLDRCEEAQGQNCCEGFHADDFDDR